MAAGVSSTFLRSMSDRWDWPIPLRLDSSFWVSTRRLRKSTTRWPRVGNRCTCLIGVARTVDLVGAGWGASLADGQAGQRPRNHQALDLAGSLEDREDLCVAVHPLHGVVAGIPVAAQDLDGFISDVDRGLACHQLGHRSLRRVEAMVVARHPASPPDQQTSGVDAAFHVCQLERHRLEFTDLAAELLALAGIFERVFIGGAR